MRIYKYVLAITDRQTISMPHGAKVLSVQIQNVCVCMWAMVDPGEPPEERVFDIIGTGHPIEKTPHGVIRSFIGTVQTGPLVWHVFERING